MQTTTTLQESARTLEENKDVVRRFFQFAATGEMDDVLIAPDIIYHGPPFVGEFRGREAFKQILAGFRSAFPNFRTRVDDLIAEGDRVSVLHTHFSTHLGDFQGIPPTGRSFEVMGIEHMRIRNGQITEFWHLDDFLSLMQQIGAVPAPGQAAR